MMPLAAFACESGSDTFTGALCNRPTIAPTGSPRPPRKAATSTTKRLQHATNTAEGIATNGQQHAATDQLSQNDGDANKRSTTNRRPKMQHDHPTNTTTGLPLTQDTPSLYHALPRKKLSRRWPATKAKRTHKPVKHQRPHEQQRITKLSNGLRPLSAAAPKQPTHPAKHARRQPRTP